MSRPVRVYLVSALPPPHGGVTVWTQTFLEAAPRFGIEPVLCRVGPRSEAEILRLSSRISRAGRGMLAPHADILLGAKGCDVVHVCVSGGASVWRGLSMVQASALRGIPAVLHVHSSLATCSRPALRWLEKLAANPLVRVVTPSHEDAAGSGQYALVDNFVSRAFTDGARWNGPSSGDGLRLLYVGWIIREKGLFELVEAIAQTPGARLDLVGPDVRPTDRIALEQRAKALGIADRVTIRPTIPHAELPALMASHDALVLPSHAESFGLVTAEAMSIGLPVIGTRVGFLWDMPDRSFIAVRTKDAASIAQALQDVATRKHELLPRLSTAALEHAHGLVAEKAVLSKWLELYRGLTSRETSVESLPSEKST